MELLQPRILLTGVINVDPPNSSHAVPVSTNVSATFDQTINSATATTRTLAVYSMQRGRLDDSSATVTTSGTTVTVNPASDFFPGETVQAAVTPAIQATTTEAAKPHVWRFRTAAGAGTGVFTDSGQRLGSGGSNTASLGDLDGDGDLDVFVTNSTSSVEPEDHVPINRVWLNSGGKFTDSGQSVGGWNWLRTLLGDLDGDGDLDAIGQAGSSNPDFPRGHFVWLNDGAGNFADSGLQLGNQFYTGFSLGDLDGDGDLDVFSIIQGANRGHRVWENDGNGVFVDSGQSLGNDRAYGISIGDLDADGDLDAFVANYNENRVWLNDGGVFSGGQRLGSHYSNAVTLGDLDGDGDLDAVVNDQLRATEYGSSEPGAAVWWNDGSGEFSDSGQRLATSFAVSLDDLDGDGDLDAYVDRVWLNDGNGNFSDSGQSIYSGSPGDLDGDGDLDIFSPRRGPNSIWLNENPTPLVRSTRLSVNSATIFEESGTATFTATLSAATTVPVTVDLSLTGTATVTSDYTISGTQIVIAPGATTGEVTVNAVQDALDEADETVIVDIMSVTNGKEDGTQQATTTILDDDEPPVPSVTLAVDNGAIPEAAGVATFSVALSEPTTVPVTVDLEISGTATATIDYAISATQISIAPGATTGSVTITAVQDTLDEPDETVILDIAAIVGGTETGTQQQTTTIVDDDAPPSFAVSDLVPTASGFRVEFNNQPDFSDLNLYDVQNVSLGPADVVLAGASSGTVAGSLVLDGSSVIFIKSAGPLSADTYTVTLRSAANGFKDSDGVLLDGDGDGTAGDDYVSSFAVSAPPEGVRTIGVPDFVRGPGQAVNLPADTTTGIPITISDGANVRAADVRIRYNPALLEIRGATAPAGGSVVVNTNTPGLAILVFFSSNSLPAGSVQFISLHAIVPSANPSEIYGTQQVLDLHGVTVGDGSDNEFPLIVDDAFHMTSYFADVSGNGRINASDASQVARFAALLDNGFGGSPNADPIVVGDISSNGRINAADASLVARFAARISVPEIPPIPGVIVIAGKDVPPRIGNSLISQSQSRYGTEKSSAPALVSKGAEITPAPAIDAVMANLSFPRFRDSDDRESNLVLEDAIDELLSDLKNQVPD